MNIYCSCCLLGRGSLSLSLSHTLTLTHTHTHIIFTKECFNAYTEIVRSSILLFLCWFLQYVFDVNFVYGTINFMWTRDVWNLINKIRLREPDAVTTKSFHSLTRPTGLRVRIIIDRFLHSGYDPIYHIGLNK